MIKFGYAITEYSTSDSVKLGILAEKCNFDSVFLIDHMMDLEVGAKADPWILLSAIGANTKRIFLCPAVVDYQRCHAAKIAQTVASLDEFTNGRAGLGIGAGEALNLIPYGIAWDEPSLRIRKLREAIEVIERLWTANRKNPANYQGAYYALKNAWLDQQPIRKPHPPIYIGALGSTKMLELVGELGNGWIPFLNSLETFSKRIEKIKESAKKAGRKIEDIDTATLILPALSEDPKMKTRATTLCKIFLVAEYNTLIAHGYKVALPKEFIYQNTLVSEEVAKKVVELANTVPNELSSKFMVTNINECIEYVDSYIKSGATHIIFRDLDFGAEPAIKKISEKVIPYFREQNP